jgi:hypothetical protein
LSSATAYESLTMFDNYLLVASRMTFCGSPNPSLWGVISETTTDLCNSLLGNSHWDHDSLYDKSSDKLESPLPLSENIPFQSAKELAVHLHPNDGGKVDIFIDDSIGVAPDLGNVPNRVIRAIPLAIRTLARPSSHQDFIPRKDIISLKKLKAEGRLEETKIVLGWLINTRSLLISLPDHKCHAWLRDIDAMLSAEKSSYQLLETLLGRLNHAACIFLPMRHFLGRLYKALYRAKAKSSWTTLSSNELDDLRLHKDFLLYANAGVSLNIISFRKPTCIYRSDASEFGLGGYNVMTGEAWRWETPIELRLRTSINSLEFMACIITIWVDVIKGDIHPEDCIYSQTDNMSAAGWLHKSNFAKEDDEHIQLATARKLASLLIDTKSCIYSQWFLGESNSMVDSLSRDFHVDSSHLRHILCTNFPLQVPFGLNLRQLPSEIVSWVTSLLHSQQQKEQWSKEQVRSSFTRGSAFSCIYNQLASSTIPTSTVLTGDNDTKYFAPLDSSSGKVDLILSLPSFSSMSLSAPPWIAWHRPSSWLPKQTQGSTLTGTLHSFYNDNSEVTDLPIPEKDLK